MPFPKAASLRKKEADVGCGDADKTLSPGKHVQRLTRKEEVGRAQVRLRHEMELLPERRLGNGTISALHSKAWVGPPGGSVF